MQHASVHTCPEAAAADGASALGSWLPEWIASRDFFTNFGHYMPRTHCLRTADGSVDWAWVGALIVLTTGVVAAYLRIYVFWRKSYFAEEPQDRVTKLLHLANVFLWCAICGYVMSIVMFFWPAYRLLAVFLVVLNVFSWRFASNLQEFRVSFSAKRFRRQLEESLRERNAELERLVEERTAEAEQARAAADAANQSKSAFLANMSHEIRTPLTAIMGFLDLSIEGGMREEQRSDSLRTVRRNCTHLLTVINDILDLSRIEAGAMSVERLDCDPWEIASSVAFLLRHRAGEKGLELSVRAEGPIPTTVRTDPTRLRQILTNLVGNAVKFTQRGSVTLTLGLDAGRAGGQPGLRFEVRDTGIGLTPAEVARLFRPFSQADASTTRRFGGAGLGLSISRSLARMLGGDIGVRSEPGRGSVFTLTIDPGPVTQVGASERPPDAPAGESPGQTRSDRRLSGRILLAEDGPDNQRLLAFVLRRAGAEVAIADNGRIAVEMAARSLDDAAPFDLVLLDMQMPELDGYGAARALRALPHCPPIVALTANAMSGDREKCLEAGCDDFASKPIDLPALLEACAAWMERARRDPTGLRGTRRAA